MDSFTLLIVVAIIHCAFYFFDTLFKSCSHYPYLYFLHNTGLQVQVFQLRWFTTAFNRFIQKCGSWRPRFLDMWFSVGANCSLVLLPVAVFSVIKTALAAWNTSSATSDAKSTFVLEPMRNNYIRWPKPAREDVHISGIGLVIFILLPVAYVEFSTEQFIALPAKRQLNIICAGVWHNVVLATAAVVVLMLLPTFLCPFFDIGSGVLVQSVHKTSPVQGPSGLLTGDKIVAVNECKVRDSDTWQSCISFAIKHPNPGYCVSSELVRNHDESVAVKQLAGGVVECCSSTSPDHLCFEYMESDFNMPELPQHSCLPGRVVIESSDDMCVKGGDCSLDLHCLKPSLNNQTRILRIKRASGKIVIFLGHPIDVYQTVQVSDYVSKYSFLSPSIPEVLTRFTKYIIVFSSGLATVNIIPCFYFDGQYIIEALSNILLAKMVKKKSMRRAIAISITFLGSIFIFGILLSTVLSYVF
ncbi:hypothetical protein C0J52_02976 [Blattella germanica]|nr:hypothetical protein C0J52_02976 [Blattella germanica]